MLYCAILRTYAMLTLSVCINYLSQITEYCYQYCHRGVNFD